MTWNWRQTLIVGTIALMLGAAIGRWSAYRFDRRKEPSAKTLDRRADWFCRRLELSPEQERKVRGILDRHHRDLAAWRAEARGRFEADREAMLTEVRALLNAEQNAKLDRLEARRREWRARRRGRRHHPSYP